MKLIKLIITALAIGFVMSSYSAEKSLYDFKWLDDGEAVYVIQNKEHIKSGGVGVDLSIIQSNSSPYQDTTGLSLGLAYYFNENWSIDFTYKKYNNKNSVDLVNLLGAYKNEVKPLIRRVDAAKLIHINWIPFYGKINTFNKIYFFDWGMGLGIGQFDTAGNYETFLVKNISITLKDEVDTGFNFRSFVKFYAGKTMTIGIEYNISGIQTITSQTGEKGMLYYNDIIVTTGFIF